jgi:excisionase family DNA binding protein
MSIVAPVVIMLDKEVSMSTLPDTLFSINEIAKHARVHHNTVRRWINDGKLNAIRLGSTLRVKGSDYNEFCAPAIAPDPEQQNKCDSFHEIVAGEQL